MKWGRRSRNAQIYCGWCRQILPTVIRPHLTEPSFGYNTSATKDNENVPTKKLRLREVPGCHK